MLSSNGDGLHLRGRLSFSQSSSQATPSQGLNTAFKGCNIADSQRQSQQGSDVSMTQAPAQPSSADTGPSQSNPLLGSQDFSTPADQQFETDPAPGGKKMRSPLALSPKSKKRQRSHLHNGSQGSLGSQGLPPSSQQVQRLSRDARYSPKTTNNVFKRQAEPEVVKVGRRLPTVTIYRELFKEMRMLGQGHFSKVWHVKNRVDGMEYAVKRSKQEVHEDSVKEQWFQEIQALAAAGTQDNIVRYFTAWLEESQAGVHFYIQLEKCESSLGQRFSVDRQPVKEAELVVILRQMAAALAHLHSRGIAHMDVKPDNIYVDEEGTYKLGDFGMATTLDTRPSVSVQEGDCRYLPFEVLNRDYNRLDKADMFALGATMYQLATGAELPEQGDQYRNLRSGKLRLIPGYTTAFHALLTKLMSSNPIDRPSPKKVLLDKLLSKQPSGYQQLALRPAGL